jgi:PAS domain S-box-containing protein
MATILLTAWPAAGYAMLAIAVAGDFRATGTLWLIQWPFCGLLTIASVLHLLTVGLGTRLGLPSILPGVSDLDRAMAREPGDIPALGADAVRRALHAGVRLPVWNAALGVAYALLVAATTATLEWVFAGTPANVWVIVRGGLLASAVYGAASLTLCELLTRPASRALRRAAAATGVEPYDGFIVPPAWRITSAVTPTVVALLVAVEIGLSPRGGSLPFAALVLLSGIVVVSLSWLQHVNHRSAANELGAACEDLAAGRDAQLVTGSIEAPLLTMAAQFNGAARRIGAARRASSDRYRALFEGAGDAILLIEPGSGVVTAANARAARLFACPAQELAGQQYLELFDDQTRTREAELRLDRATATDAFMADATAVRRDGRTVPVDISLAVVRLGDGEWILQAIVRDVGERQRIERELRHSVRRFDELYRLAVSLNDHPVELAGHSVRALAELLEVPLATVERLDGEDIVVVAMVDGERVTHGLRVPLAGTPCATVRERRTQCVVFDAAVRYPEDAFLRERGVHTYAGVPILDRRGEAVGVVTVMDTKPRTFRDADLQLLHSFARRLGMAYEQERLSRERDALTRRLGEQNAELRAAQARLLESDRVKTEFLGMMSHELRTPLNILLGYTRMLLEDIADGDAMDPSSRGEVLERMLSGGTTLADLVEDTLSVLRLEAGALRLDPEPLDLRGFLGELAGTDRLLRPGGVDEHWIVDPDVPAIVTDRRKLRQVVTNLVGNARKFTQQGRIDVHLALAPDGETVRLTVSDTGCGIGAEHLPYIFDLYRQAPSGRQHDGCGLGLYIVRKYVELMGGSVSCTSTLQRGTTFTVDLPRRRTSTASRAA